MKTALYPGSFDPVTNGHMNIIERAARLFDRVIVCIMINSEKAPFFTLREREQMVRSATAHLQNVEVDAYEGLTAEYAKLHNCCTMVKGLRAGSDFEKEFQMAMINRKLNPALESMFLTSEHQYMYLSSSIVKELGMHGADLTDFLPESVLPDFQKKITRLRKIKEAEQ
ncbi:MAG: pantetheine-phosphate adenylyltransferase [Oscillospiraceae bacterium]|jgi:pantetheine-phosphate adenylyltransferase|nr:pantetheine-phosphate adenylyltransferase [Oscillospiraceae bacterium]